MGFADLVADSFSYHAGRISEHAFDVEGRNIVGVKARRDRGNSGQRKFGHRVMFSFDWSGGFAYVVADVGGDKDNDFSADVFHGGD